MPQEAADNTAQMRKVIVDQIEALAELNRIVAHHGRGLDVVTSGRASVQRQEEPGDGSRRRPQRGAHARRRQQRIDAAAAGPRHAGLAPHRSPAGLARRARTLDATDGCPTCSTAPTPAAADARLRVAARRRAPANPLESLSLDIGRLMDRNLAAEMWDRYQRGESKAFTKRLYTPAGQKAFDEVARKYRADRSFKQTVDRYIAEFERLLDEVAREDRGPQALRGHLTSETGLVYTLLAHAAGRLG